MQLLVLHLAIGKILCDINKNKTMVWYEHMMPQITGKALFLKQPAQGNNKANTQKASPCHAIILITAKLQGSFCVSTQLMRGGVTM